MMTIQLPKNASNIQAVFKKDAGYLIYNRTKTKQVYVHIGCPFDIESIENADNATHVQIRKYTVEEFKKLEI